MDATEFFRSEWTPMSKRIAGSLARRGLQPSDRDDVMQETAMRLFRGWEQLDPDRPVEPYARVIATNVWRDSMRRGPRDEPVEQLPETGSPADAVEHVCVVRDELSRVRRAMGLLRPEQSRVLYAIAAEEMGDTGVRPPVADALRMARMRARRDLRAVLQTASGFLAVLGACVRRHGQTAAIAAVPVAFTVLALFGAGLGGAGSSKIITVSPAQAPSAALATSAFGAAAPRVVGSRIVAAQVPAQAKATTSTRKPTTPKYYWVKAGEVSAGAYLEVQVGGKGARVGGDNANGLPACVLGADHGSDPLVAHADCER